MTGWLLVGGIAAAYDAYAIRTKRETLSCCAGRHPWRTAALLAAFALHVNTHRLPWRSP